MNTSTPISVPIDRFDSQTPFRARWALFWISVLLLGHGILICLTARSTSVTHDEFWHLPVGLLNLQTGDFLYEPLNPPLTRLVAAIPAYYNGVRLAPKSVPILADSTQYGRLFLRENPRTYLSWFIWGRCLNGLFSVAIGIMLAIWGWSLWGPSASCLITLLWCAEPTVIAHASLITPDMGLACLWLATLFSLWRYLLHASWRNTCWIGLWLGLAQLTKFTAILLVPIVIVGWVCGYLRQPKTREASHPKRIWHGLTLLALSLVVLNLGYLNLRATYLGQLTLQSQTLSNLVAAVPWLGTIPIPVPTAFMAGIDLQRHIMESQHPVYLDGHWSTLGFRSYFLFALVYKLPHLCQFLGILGLMIWLRHCPSTQANQVTCNRALALVYSSGLLLVMTASFSGMQLGIRYILPSYLAIIMGAGYCALDLYPRDKRWRQMLPWCLSILAILSLRFQPDQIGYFNELAGGPPSGPQHLLDSNIDWGQDLLGLKRYLAKNPRPQWYVAYFGSVPPGDVGINYELPPGGRPFPGSYAVSVNFVYGRPHVIFSQQDEPRAVGLEEFGYLRAFTPRHRIGSSILIYEILPTDILRWEANSNFHP